MAILPNTDLRNRGPGPFIAGAERGHAGQVGLEGEHDDVVHGTEVVAELFQRNAAIQPQLHVCIDSGPRRVEPAVGPMSANLDLAHGGEILLKSATIVLAELIAERTSFVEGRIKDAAAALQTSPLPGRAALGFYE